MNVGKDLRRLAFLWTRPIRLLTAFTQSYRARLVFPWLCLALDRVMRTQKLQSTGSRSRRPSIAVLRLSNDSLISTIGISFP